MTTYLRSVLSRAFSSARRCLPASISETEDEPVRLYARACSTNGHLASAKIRRRLITRRLDVTCWCSPCCRTRNGVGVSAAH